MNKRISNYLFWLGCFPLLLCGCGGQPTSQIDNFTEAVYTPEYAEGFRILSNGADSCVLITTTNPWQGNDSVTTQLLILREGQKAPEGFAGQVLEGDAKRIVAMSSTHVAMLDAIGAVDRIVGVSGRDFITNAAIQSRRDSVADVGYEGNIDYELLLVLDPDLVLLYGVNGASAMEGKLEEMNVPYMYVGDYLEESPLGKAEWLVALAEVTGIREYGKEVFATIPDNYNRLKRLVAEADNKSPKVMLNAPYGDSWFMPPRRNYMARLIQDAGGEYLFDGADGNEAIAIDMEEAYRMTLNADIWLNTGQAESLDDLKRLCPRMSDMPCVTRGEVYNNTARRTASGGNDFFESAIVHPDIVLRDLIGIFHPGLTEGNLTYYHKLR